eukprot:11733964-Karenia_brevis.AAC.1
MQKLDPKCLDALHNLGFETDTDLANLKAEEIVKALNGVDDTVVQQVLDLHSSLSDSVHHQEAQSSSSLSSLLPPPRLHKVPQFEFRRIKRVCSSQGSASWRENDLSVSAASMDEKKKLAVCNLLAILDQFRKFSRHHDLM